MRINIISYSLLFLLVEKSFTLPQAVDDESCSSFHVETSECFPYWSLDGEITKPPVLVVTLDGFRADYFDRLRKVSTEGIVRLARCGVKADWMVPVFPTITLPNHYSIVTGLYPESHGIVAHEFYDPGLGRNFSLPAAGFDFTAQNLLDSVWWIGEPIWYTVKRQGKKSAAYFWPGSYINDPVRRPDYWVQYNSSIPFQQRINQVIDWLLLPALQRPNFIGLYLEEPDSIGHNKGPDSVETDEGIHLVDSQIKFLIHALGENGILGCVDLIILSDHGMASVPFDQNVFKLEEIIQGIRAKAYCFDCAEGATSTLRPIVDTLDEQDQIAFGLECRNENVRIYEKWDFPRRHHYANSRRISNLLFDMTNTWRAVIGTEDFLPGNHGWDNLYSEMQALFVAQGPSFRRDGAIVDPFHNIELYNLMCWLIGVDPAPNNGTWGALHHLLNSTPPMLNTTIPPRKEILLYPTTEEEYFDRLNNREACELLPGKNNPLTDSSFNLTESVIQSSIELHAPWGLPSSTNKNVKILASKDMITGFNVQDGIQSWVSYTIPQNTFKTNLTQLIWRLDMRLRKGDLSICDRLNITNDSVLLAPLFFPNFSSSSVHFSDGLVETNAIEISTAFLKYWQDIGEKISESASNSSGLINVIAGPVRTSRSPAIFLIITYCQVLPNCSKDEWQVQSFLLPTHLRYSRDCLPTILYLRSHLATVRDVERATGLTLFSSLSAEDKVRILARTVLNSGNFLVDPYPPATPNEQVPNSSGNLVSSFISSLSREIVTWLLIIGAWLAAS